MLSFLPIWLVVYLVSIYFEIPKISLSKEIMCLLRKEEGEFSALSSVQEKTLKES